MFIKDLEKDWYEFERIKEEGLSKCVHHGRIAPSVYMNPDSGLP